MYCTKNDIGKKRLHILTLLTPVTLHKEEPGANQKYDLISNLELGEKNSILILFNLKYIYERHSS